MKAESEEKIIEQITLLELFVTFSQLSLCGFGGVGPWIYRFIVEKKQWLSAAEFTELLSLGQVLPGANVTNFAGMFGYRVKGISGAICAILGLLFFPFFIVIAIGIFYERHGQVAQVQGALRGILSVSAGMIVFAGIKLSIEQIKNWNKFYHIILIFLTLFSVIILKLPLPITVLLVFFTGLFLDRVEFK